jgi:ubiquitin carboxyl-terminal hydrolase 34
VVDNNDIDEKIEEIYNPTMDNDTKSAIDKGLKEKGGAHKKSTINEMMAKEERERNASFEWSEMFIKCGGLAHLYDIFLSGVLQKGDKSDAEHLNEWRHDCLACLLRILCLLGVDEMRTDENQIIIPKLNQHTLSLFDVKLTLERIASILNEESLPINPNHFKTGLFGRASVIHFAMNLLVCFSHSSPEVRENLWKISANSLWLQRLILDDPEPTVRREACAALYRLCLGNSKTYNELLAPLLSKLVSFLPMAEQMRPAHLHMHLSPHDEGKEPYGPACRDYFWLLCRLVDALTPELIKESLDEQGLYERMACIRF